MEQSQHEVINPNQGLLSFLIVHDNQDSTYISPHWHRAVELSYTLKGSIDQFYVAGENFQTHSGRILVINTQEVHSIRVLKHKEESNLALTITYPYPFLIGQCERIAYSRFDINHPEQFSNAQKKAYGQLQEILKKIVSDSQADSSDRNLKINLGILKVLEILVEFFLVDDYSTVRQDNRLQIAERIKKIDDFLRLHYQESIHLEDLAEHCHLSRSYMARFFKTHLGVTLGQYLRNIRAQKARDHLIETKDSFTNIALEHGFSGLRSMNRALEDNFGKNARQIRNDVKNS
ncbi:AraC-like ligand binding domain-containing protein [Streptococcus equinus]|uniref:AraC-like ligand binding domain-containing protein n=1 Tax=Streptococcus equinus TaxID=1335 RepID=A0A1H0XQJ0_STREI|nr:response regulator transcription factor [Streptococcus equinus]SDQ05103.1 AraC-like ligand binding domain-containing protein [Streptococcus equinus]